MSDGKLRTRTKHDVLNPTQLDTRPFSLYSSLRCSFSPEKVCMCGSVEELPYLFQIDFDSRKFMFFPPHFHTFGRKDHRHRPITSNKDIDAQIIERSSRHCSIIVVSQKQPILQCSKTKPSCLTLADAKCCRNLPNRHTFRK
jgi:hypothetical protein